MEPDAGDPGIARAGAAVAARRRELDIKQRNLAKFKIINAGALIAFEKGRSWPRERTRAKLEEILQWPAGTIATIRYGGQVPGAAPEPPADDGAASLIAGTVEVAMTTLGAAIESLPADDDPEFSARATVILAELRKLEAVVARAAQHSRGTPDVVLALRTVRGCYDDLMFRAAAAPGATLGQRLYAARRRANLSAAETANAAGLPVELVVAVEAGEPAADTDTAALNEPHRLTRWLILGPVPLPDLVRNVGDVLSRADSLFGTADPDAAATAADQLTDATDVIRSGQEQAAAMSGDAITNYADFAQGTRDALDHLSGVESDLGHRLQEAAEAVTAANTASQSALDVVSSASDALEHLTDTPAAELAVIHALRAQVGHELELIRTHQAVAEQLGAQLRGLGY